MSGEGWFVVTEHEPYPGYGGGYGFGTETSVGQTCKTVLGYRNVLSTEATGGLVDAYVDAEFPLDNLFDDSYQTEFSPDDDLAATTIEMIFSYEEVKQLDYFGLLSKNAQECGLVVNVSVLAPGDVTYQPVVIFSQIRNGKPAMAYFGIVNGPVDCVAVKIVLTYTSKPFITTFYCGKAVVLPKTFSMGVKPGHLSCIDEVKGFDADEGFNLVGGRRLTRGFRFSGTINKVRMDFVESFWAEYTNYVLNLKPFFLMWNTDKPNAAMYGTQTPSQLTKPEYKTSLFSELSFEVTGWA